MKNVSAYQAQLIALIQEKGVEHVFRWFSDQIDAFAKAQVADIIEDMAAGNENVPPELIAQLTEAWLIQNLMSEANAIRSPSAQVVATALANARVAELSSRISRGNYINKPVPDLILTNTKLSDLRTRLHNHANEFIAPAEAGK